MQQNNYLNWYVRVVNSNLLFCSQKRYQMNTFFTKLREIGFGHLFSKIFLHERELEKDREIERE